MPVHCYSIRIWKTVGLSLGFCFQFLIKKLFFKCFSAKQNIPSTILLRTQKYITPRFSLLHSEHYQADGFHKVFLGTLEL